MDKNKRIEVLDYVTCQIRYKNQELRKIKNNINLATVTMKEEEEMKLLNDLKSSLINLMLFYECEIVSNEVEINDIFSEIAEEG